MSARAGSPPGAPELAPDLFRVTLAVGAAALAVAAVALVLAARAVIVGADAPVHRVEAFGNTIVYPAANVAAVVVLGMAAVGLLALVRALRSVGRQLLAQRRLARELAGRCVRRAGTFRVVEDARPTAMCAGLLRPRIYVSTAALELLGPHELQAVLAHEAHHRRRRDPLRLAVAQILGDALFFLPAVRRLARDHALLTEIDADAAAVAVRGDESGLARAMLRLARAEHPDGAVGIEAARVDSLLGEPPRHLLPLLFGVAVIAGLALALLVVMLAGRTAAGYATLALPGLSRQPCVVALALVPGTLGVLAALFLRRGRRG
jgi:Zn-dependent protease with chaperone function